ncbi:MAG: C45 family peptidase [Crocinitomicaceae bacterium]
MQLHFKAISEPGKPGVKWQRLFNIHWPAYRKWLISEKRSETPTLEASKEALKKYMPEMIPTYNRLCKLIKADPEAAQFLTGFQPPSYLNGCAQVVLKGKEPRLIRNYDYHPALTEGTQLLSCWNGKQVIATSDCLIGVLDGINEDGLAVSLSFGGRPEVGIGFGIPFILRYILEFCSTHEEAVAALCRIPTHMAYNVTVVDKSGGHKTVRLAPGRKPEVTEDNYVTNHQGTVNWPENAAFNQTVERSASLEQTLLLSKMDAELVLNAFLAPPLYNIRYAEGFGTLYTAEYLPKKGKVNIYWPGEKLSQSFKNFTETYKRIDFDKIVSDLRIHSENVLDQDAETSDPTSTGWQETVTESIVNAMANKNPTASRQQLEKLRQEIRKRGVISWKAVMNYWNKLGKSTSEIKYINRQSIKK